MAQGKYQYLKLLRINRNSNSGFFQSYDRKIGIWFNFGYMKQRPSINTWTWFFIRRDYTAFYEEAPSIFKQLITFYENYKIGDSIVLPVIEVNPNYLKAAIGPTCTVRVNTNKPIRLSSSKQCYFTITNLERNEEGKIIISLEYNEQIDDEIIYSGAPKDLSRKNLVILKETIAGEKIDKVNYAALQRKLGDNFTEQDLRIFLEEKYQTQLAKKTLTMRRHSKTLFLDIDLDIKNDLGVPLIAGIKRTEGRDTFVLILIGEPRVARQMEKYIYIPDWDSLLSDLAGMVLPGENWGIAGGYKYSVLKSYILFGYYKAFIDGLIKRDNEKAENLIYNTGLVDSSYDDIYCWIEKSMPFDDSYERDYTIKGFACRGKGRLGKDMNSVFTSFPNAPSYISRDNLSSLFFDTSKELICDYDHIVKERLYRLPNDFILRTLAFDPAVVSQQGNVHAKLEDGQSLGDYIIDNPTLVRSIENALKSAVETAIKYCRWNYKTAVPMYYSRHNNISLLLPLMLNNDTIPSVALIVERLPNGNYQGQTILDLDQAYKDARQICRPNSDWLTLNNITEEINEDED